MSTERFDFSSASGATLSGRLELPDGNPRAWALFAHCFTCGKNAAAATRVARALAARGYAVLRFDFTGLGNSEGDFANTSFTSNVEDLVAAARALDARGRAPALLVGHSLGGAAALVAAEQIESVRAVATIGAPSDTQHVKALFAGALDEIAERGRATVSLAGRPFEIGAGFVEDLAQQSVTRHTQQLKRALLVMHSPIDNIVGIDNATEIYTAARHPKSFVSLDSADHLLTDADDAEFAADVLGAWAQRYVGDSVGADAPSAADDGSVVVESEAGLAQRITSGRHELIADEPKSVGGADRGLDPYRLVLAGLGACTSMTLKMYAGRKQWPLDRVRVRLTHEKLVEENGVRRERPLDVFRRELTIEGELDDAQRERLLEIANKCPVHRTLEENDRRVETHLVSG